MTDEDAMKVLIDAAKKGLLFKVCPTCGERYGYFKDKCPYCKEEKKNVYQTDD